MLKDGIESLLLKTARKTRTLQFAMNLPELDVHYSFSSMRPNQRFHSASVGKLMTATLIFMAIEQGRIALDTPVWRILEPGTLDRLSVFNGRDDQEAVTIGHLLGHTSGINDYFEGKTIDGSAFVNDVIQNHDRFWKPSDLLDFTRNRQQAIARPGDKFLYSDTGYILLGLIIESVFGMPFNQALETFIFLPCGMQETHLCFYSEGFDQAALAPLIIAGTDVHLFRSLSCDFSGGGLSTTAPDLLAFLDRLQHGRLVSRKSLDRMARFEHRFHQGLHYGYGMMQVRFNEFFFLLNNLPRLQGHIGISGSHAWYDPANGNAFVLNVGNTKDMALSFQLLIKIIQMVQRESRDRQK